MQQSNPIRHLENNSPFRRLIFGITGASGAILGIRLLEALKSIQVESHLVLSESAPITIQQETKYQVKSIKTLSAVANSFSNDLLSRAADVTLKEGRPLILVVRETPYHPGHGRLMTEAASAGAMIFPPVPAFYARPQSLEDIINNTVGRVLAPRDSKRSVSRMAGEII